MRKYSFAKLQSFVPQHALSKLFGQLAESHTPWLKNFLIERFIQKYQIDMRLAEQEDPAMYATFNDFFTRQLKPALRPIITDENQIVSPADGAIAQIGTIQQDQLLQAKGFYFSLDMLLANHPDIAKHFYGGHYATIYLAPHNYHRVHMPISGKLTQSIYVPGKLFSVNRTTAEYIPNLYSRNERVITLFETHAGSMAVILVGAMIVGSMQMAWMDKPMRANNPYTETYSPALSFAKGDELGRFLLGSTVILLLQKNKIHWQPNLQAQSLINYGQSLGTLNT